MKTLVIEKDKLAKNVNIIKEMTGSYIFAVIKADGYGLGLCNLAEIYRENGIEAFAVSSLEEALTLRENGFDNPILLLNPLCCEDEADICVSNNIIATIGSVNTAVMINEAAQRQGVVAEVHVEIDTGFGKFGFLPEKMHEVYLLLKSLDNIKIGGTYTHLSFSFAKCKRPSVRQFDRFLKCVDGMKQNGVETGMLHIANSCAFLREKSFHLDAVRVGSALLGRLQIRNSYGLKKIGFLRSKIIEIHDLPEKHNIGYANTFKTKKAIRVGLVPVGYSHGFKNEKQRDTFRIRDTISGMLHCLRDLNKKMYVTVKGKRARIVGRVRINDFLVDLTGVDVAVGDEVIMDINPLFVDSGIEREIV